MPDITRGTGHVASTKSFPPPSAHVEAYRHGDHAHITVHDLGGQRTVIMDREAAIAFFAEALHKLTRLSDPT